MIAALAMAALLAWSIFGTGRPLPCNEACTFEQFAAEQRLAVTVDLGPAGDGPVTVEGGSHGN